VTGAGPRRPIRRRYADTALGQIHYRERGEGRPVLLLHQTASSSVMWERAMRCFPDGLRLIAVDTPGFGESDGPGALPEDGLGYYARRVAGFLDALGLERAAIVGHHTGAMIAAELAAAHPDRAERLVLIGCVVIGSEQERRERLAAIDRWQADARGDFVTRTLIPRMHLSVTTDDPGHFARELTAYLQAGPDYWWAYHAVFSYDAPRRLPLVSAPALCVVGTGEPSRLIEWTRDAAGLIAAARYVEVEDATAEMVWQVPETVAGIVAGFLRDGDGGGTAR
jgi:pimeloyl-ACP methyl ester carboxylesterase